MAVNSRAGQSTLEIVAAIQSVVRRKRVGLHDPVFEGNERRYLDDCINSGFVSSAGPFVAKFEQDLASFVGAPYAVALVNGTSALHLALVGLGVRPGDEVLVPALSFVATANAVALAGATPHFVDVSWESWGVGAEGLREYLTVVLDSRGKQSVNRFTGRPVTALVPMHTLGFAADGDGLAEVAREFGLILVEDAAEALGTFADGSHAGLAGQAGCFSFNGNKTITTGGGGAIVTKDGTLAERLKHLSTTAKVPHRYEFDHDQIGYNYRMPNVNAALGVAQLEQLPQLLGRQRALHSMYVEAFDGLALGKKPSERPGTVSNYWLQAFLLDDSLRGSRDIILNACLDLDIPVRPLWKPLNRLMPYLSSPSANTPVADDLYSRVICLPSSPVLAG